MVAQTNVNLDVSNTAEFHLNKVINAVSNVRHSNGKFQL